MFAHQPRIEEGIFQRHFISDFVPFVRGGAYVNDMDAAVAQVLDGKLPDLAYDIASASTRLTVVEPTYDMVVTLQGRSSGVTTGTVKDLNFAFLMKYDGVGTVGFRNQVHCEHYTAEGDSGSLELDTVTGGIVGLHFGEAVDGGSVFSRIGPIMQALNFTFTPD